MNKALFSSLSMDWPTPKKLYDELDAEFHFDDDPCPLGGIFGLDRPWGKSVFVNPPYGRAINAWIEKGFNESQQGKIVVFLLPARTDTAWFHDFVLPHAKEIRFIRGRLKFDKGNKWDAPFPSVIIIFGSE